MSSRSSKLKNIYRVLYKKFGPQKWWPADSPFEVIVGAVLTQNTNWLNVEKAINNLKKAGKLSLKSIRKLRQEQLAALIRPAGYFNIKAKRLQNVINFLYNNYQGSLSRFFGQDIGSLRRELLSINGVGPETADSIMLYAGNKPVFVVDAYTKRFLSRHKVLAAEKDYHDFQRLFMDNLPKSVKMFNEYHALIVRLAKEYCLSKNPKCKICPLKLLK